MIKKEHPELWNAANHFLPPGGNAGNPIDTWVNPIPVSVHRSTWTAEHAIQLLDERDKDRPFLLHCSYYNPHHPFAPPAPYDTMYDPETVPLPIPVKEGQFDGLPEHFRREHVKDWGAHGKRFCDHTDKDWRKLIAYYYGMISLIDDSMGQVLDYLRRNDILDNTAVFFISDHGELLGDHGICLKGNFHYQGLIRVPFLLSYPQKCGKNLTVDSLTLLYDIMPTILELAGVAGPPMTARSMLPLIGGGGEPRDAALVEGYRMRSLICNGYRLSVYEDTGKGELFNLRDDPDEMNNLWEKEKKVRSELVFRLSQMMIQENRPWGVPIGRW